MQEDGDFDPLGLVRVDQPARNVDIIAKCAMPAKMIPINPRSRRKSKLPNDLKSLRSRTRSSDDLSTLENRLNTLFQNESDVPEISPIARQMAEKKMEPEVPNETDFPDVNFESLLNYRYKMKNKIDLNCIMSSLEAQMIKEKNDLDDFLFEASQHANNIIKISDNLVPHKLHDIRFLRNNAIRAVLYEEEAIFRCSQYLAIARYNITLIDSFQSFLNDKAKKLDDFPGVDIDSFLQRYLKQCEYIESIDRHLESLSMQIKPLKPAKGDSVSQFLSPDTKSGRIVARFIKRVKDMTYSDLEVILSAITPNDKLLGTIRSILFDLAWQQMEFPFGTVSHIVFPNIFDLTPRSISPPYLDDIYLDMPFNQLNGANWPYRFTEDYLFTIMCCRNPFSMANEFCKMIQQIANVLSEQAVRVGGEKEEDVEIGFDNLFANLLVCILAFGCSKILDSLEYCAQFLDYATEAHQQFAMTHCAGIVEHIRSTRTEDFRRRVKLNQSVPIFFFRNPT